MFNFQAAPWYSWRRELFWRTWLARLPSCCRQRRCSPLPSWSRFGWRMLDFILLMSQSLLQDLHQMLLNNSTCRHRAPPEEPSPPSSCSSLCCALINHYPASTKWWWMFRFKQLFDKCNNWCAHDGVLSNIWYLLLTDQLLYGGLLFVDLWENLHSILTKTSSTIDWAFTTSSWWFYLKCTPKLCWRTSFVLCNRASPVSQVVPTTDDHKGWKIHLFS